VSHHPFHRTNPEQVGAIYKACSFYVNWPADFANSMVIVRVVLQYFFVLGEDKRVGYVFNISVYSPLSISLQHFLNVFSFELARSAEP